MRFSTSWLSEYVELPDPAGELPELMSMLGLVVEDVQQGAGGPIYDVDVPTNRPDAMNHVGLAREIAAATGACLDVPDPRPEEIDEPASEVASVAVDDADGCARYVARVLEDVSVGPSPPWLGDRLGEIGVRPVNNVVDATNYVLWELGHPLHAFDLDRLADRKIVVRRARADETLETLDDQLRELDPEDLLIADAERPIALAGVMGGADTEIREGARRVLLEGAWFDPLTVRRTAARHGLHTDASHRFERGLPRDGMLRALDRCAELIARVAGGRILAGRIDVAEPAPEPVRLRLRTGRIASVLGVELDEDEVADLLERLEFRVARDDDGLEVEVPPFRGDVGREADLIEEVARHHGYDRLPSTLPVIRRSDPSPNVGVVASRRLQELCAGCGFWEAMTFAFTSEEDQTTFPTDGADLLPVANPLAETMKVLRANLLPGLLRAVAHNLNRRQSRVRLYELGRCFVAGDGEQIAREHRHLALAACGPARSESWCDPERELDLFDLKGVVSGIFDRMGWPPPRWVQASVPGLQPGLSSRLVAGDETLGWCGRVAADVAARYDVEKPVWAVEIDVEALLERPPGRAAVEELPRYPASDRDLSILLDRETPYDAVAAALAEPIDLPLEEIRLLDVYEGDDLPAGQRSMTLRLTFRADDRTLTTGEIDDAHAALVKHLEDRIGARLR